MTVWHWVALQKCRCGTRWLYVSDGVAPGGSTQVTVWYWVALHKCRCDNRWLYVSDGVVLGGFSYFAYDV